MYTLIRIARYSNRVIIVSMNAMIIDATHLLKGIRP